MRSLFLLLSTAVLIGCAEPDASPPTDADITLGNGSANAIELAGATRYGKTIIVPSVTAAHDSFVVLHPFRDSAPVREDYVAARFINAGTTADVALRVDDTISDGQPFIIMLHRDVDEDQMFDFGDGVTVPDAPVFEGSTMIAAAMQAPVQGQVTPDIIRASAAEQRDKAMTYHERADYRSDSVDARVKALIHDWMYSAERSDRAGVHAMPLMADDFALNFSSGVIDSEASLDGWLKGPASFVAAARHEMSDVIYRETSPGQYAVTFKTDWQGLTKDGGLMRAGTTHNWDVTTAADGSLRIKTVNVAIDRPFAPAEWD